MSNRDFIDVVLVDDHILVRESIGWMLRAHPPIRVAGEATGPDDALRFLAHSPADLLITGIGLGAGSNGLQLIETARRMLPALPILVLTRHQEDHIVCTALAAGASGYIVKSARCEELVQAILEVARGGSYLHPAVSLPVMRGLRNRHTESLIVERDSLGQLSHREKEILTLLSRGFNNNQMASQLHLSLSTVKTHLRTAYRKLSAADRTQAVLKALQLQLIPSLSGTESPSGLAAKRTGT